MDRYMITKVLSICMIISFIFTFVIAIAYVPDHALQKRVNLMAMSAVFLAISNALRLDMAFMRLNDG